MTSPDQPRHARGAEWDAAYVLGALSPAERREFEDHLDDCDRCRAAVAELSALPGLLGRLDGARAFALVSDAADDSAGTAPALGPPADLVERIRSRERSDRIRRRLGMTGAIAAAATIAAVLALVLPPMLSPQPEPAVAVQLAPTEEGVPLEASIRLTSLAWGTRIDMECGYLASAGAEGGYGPTDYAMWVVDRDGAASALSTWTSAPDGTVSVTAGTALAIADIAEIEVRTAAGDRVLLAAEP